MKIEKLTLVALLALASTGLSAYSVYQTTAAFHGSFPGSQAINVVAKSRKRRESYSFGTSPGQQILAAGTTGTFSLSLNYAGTTATSLKVSYNATNANVPGAFSYQGLVGQGNFVGSYTVTINGQVIAPLNGQGSVSCSNVQCFATVSPVHGQNSFPGTIDVSPSALVDSFTLQWFADQA